LLEYAKNILKRWGATINEHYCYRRSTWRTHHQNEQVT
jgi:hypothetical protein